MQRCPLCDLEVEQGHLDYFGCVKTLGDHVRQLRTWGDTLFARLDRVERKVVELRTWTGLNNGPRAPAPARNGRH